MFWEECKYEEKETYRYITQDIDVFSSNDYDGNINGSEEEQSSE